MDSSFLNFCVVASCISGSSENSISTMSLVITPSWKEAGINNSTAFCPIPTSLRLVKVQELTVCVCVCVSPWGGR